MTREEARRRAEIMSAYANGKEIEILDTDGNWVSIKNPKFYWGNIKYRIKKEATYRPFRSKEECWEEMQKHQPFGWLTGGESLPDYFIVNDVCDSGIYRGSFYEFKLAYKRFIFADGTPFGIKED